MNKNSVDFFEKLVGQLTSVYDEISLLSKKNPNDAINKFKLRFINKLLSESNDYLALKYRPFEDFSLFDEDDVPQNGDAVFILSQYLQCFEKLRADNVVQKNGGWWWNLEAVPGEVADSNGRVLIRTTRPRRLID
jgi:hypothetical protein